MSRVSSVVPFPIQSTIETLREDHIIQRLLCDDLERVADHLPALPRQFRLILTRDYY